MQISLKISVKIFIATDLNSSMQSLMDRITSLERMLNPVTQPVNRYRPHTSRDFENLSFQRPKVSFGSGKVSLITKYYIQ